MVDFAFVLQPDPEIKKAFRNLPMGMKSRNHMELIKTQPVAVSIETKSAAASWTDGRHQMTLWLDAWLQRLQLLRTVSHPAIPVLFAQGADWFLSLAEGHLSIRGHIHVGNTLTVGLGSCFLTT